MKTIQERLETPHEETKRGIEKGVEKGVEILTETQQTIVELIGVKTLISIKELMSKSNLSKKTVYFNINKLKNIGVLKKVCPERGGQWEINE